jgi:hypothetical protein
MFGPKGFGFGGTMAETGVSVPAPPPAAAAAASDVVHPTPAPTSPPVSASAAAGSKSCPKCQATNLPTAKFCAECGEPTPAVVAAPPAASSSTCSKCQATNLPAAKFCAECGEPLRAPGGAVGGGAATAAAASAVAVVSAPVAAAAEPAAPKLGGGGDRCPKCSKPVYFAEKVRAHVSPCRAYVVVYTLCYVVRSWMMGDHCGIVACADGVDFVALRLTSIAQIMGPGQTTYHKMCFRCTTCNKMLDATLCTDKDGAMYCKGCYGAAFGPKVHSLVDVCIDVRRGISYVCGFSCGRRVSALVSTRCVHDCHSKTLRHMSFRSHFQLASFYSMRASSR